MIVCGKQNCPQWLTIEQAEEHCQKGLGVWEWASNDDGLPEVVMACCGDIPTLETLAAVSLLQEYCPTLRIRVVNVVDLMRLHPTAHHPHGLSDETFDELFPVDCPVVFAFHGYPTLIHHLTYHRNSHDNWHVHGYCEEGTTTTPFDMVVRNGLDRFHLAESVLRHVRVPIDHDRHLQTQIERMLTKHHAFIREEGIDLPKISEWCWDSSI